MELRLRTADGLLSTRPGDPLDPDPPAHPDELLGVMRASRRWGLGRPLVHVIDREADPVGHDRRWHAAGHRFVVRANATRVVTHAGVERKLAAVVGRWACRFADVRDERGRPRVVGRGC